jgi:hypothetical protein
MDFNLLFLLVFLLVFLVNLSLFFIGRFTKLSKIEYLLVMTHFILNPIFIFSVIKGWKNWIHFFHCLLPIYLVFCLYFFQNKKLLILLLLCFSIILVMFYLNDDKCIISELANRSLGLSTPIIKFGLIFMAFLTILKLQ